MVGVAPAANAPQAFDGAETLATNGDAASGHENAGTAAVLPPDVVAALGAMTMLSAREAEVPASAPMTKRMSESARSRPAPALPSGAPSAPLPRNSTSVALPASSSGAGSPAAGPMAAPLEAVPLERKPLVTTYALSPMAVVDVIAQRPASEPRPASYVDEAEAAPRAPIPRVGSGTRGSAPPSPYVSAPPAADTIKGMPLVSESGRPHASMPVRSDETMMLAPAAVPLARMMVSMPPAMPAGAQQQGVHAQQQGVHAQQQGAHAQQRPAPHLSPMPFVAGPMDWSPQGPPPNHPSHPSLADTRSRSDEQPAPLTYQVYNPASSPGRSPALSRAYFSDPVPAKASLGLRVCLALLGVCVVVGTAGAIILSGADDPLKGATPPEPSAAVSAALAPPPTAPPTVIGDPTLSPPIATAGSKPASSSKPKPTGSAALKRAKIPPNRLGGGGTLPTKRK